MRAYLSVELTDHAERYIKFVSPGGYTVELRDNSEFEFDFNESYASASKTDPYVLDFELRVPDFDSFPDMAYLPAKLADAVSINDIYVYTGEPDKHGRPPVDVRSIRSFEIEYETPKDPNNSDIPDILDIPDLETDIVTIRREPGLLRIRFTDKALADYNENYES